MKSSILAILFGIFFLGWVNGQNNAVRLIMRIDDMGFSHSANMACIDAYKNGIATSVEVIVPGPWFEEAVDLLNANPGLDVGIHLAITSEWKNLKWRPLTNCKTITDSNGYFFPMVWKNERFPAGHSILESNWDIKEVEMELRAQIELALKRIPHISHLSAHMGCLSINEDTKALMRKLATDYNLAIFPEDYDVRYAPQWSGNEFSAEEKEARFIEMLGKLKAGNWLTVEHPGYNDEELRTVGHIGYENVAADRAGVTAVLTSEKVKTAVKAFGIELISYKDLLKR